MPYDQEDAPESEGSPEPEGGGDDESYVKAGRTIRHAISDGDDAALAHAICDLVDIHNSAEPEEEPKGKGKPNLAALLLMKRKK